MNEKKDDDIVRISFNIRRALKEEFKQLVKKQHQTVPNILRSSVAYYVKCNYWRK